MISGTTACYARHRPARPVASGASRDEPPVDLDAGQPSGRPAARRGRLSAGPAGGAPGSRQVGIGTSESGLANALDSGSIMDA
ncbi:hypothetical protein GCM10022225_05000 [Plantactinospora mayteni]|uniref:Uncharacterized protein n=1 Tax=Plantactinospora mayteni TaxID=566021 RepID=A0ABQ4EQR1_9ACTN|nr:hypothetical protein [Plantactinospora mayteni]GIG96989.1 hypothetical protein Pma05_35620 [Plantactinospora mayteni]